MQLSGDINEEVDSHNLMLDRMVCMLQHELTFLVLFLLVK
jgi:hypothetical protein